MVQIFTLIEIEAKYIEYYRMNSNHYMTKGAKRLSEKVNGCTNKY